MLLHLALLASLPLSQASLSWVYARGSRQKNNGGDQGISYEDGTSPAELAAILQGSRTLEAYSRTPDCFRRVATLIRARCSDLETDESERVKAALSMTLCEIATADHYSPPLECAAFQPYAQENHFAESPGKCVSALSRSAQYWSSYSGYLREVSQLCFAFQRWNDIDTAKEIHHNTTVESIAVLRYLSEREKRMQEAREESDAILEAIRGTLDQLRISAAGIGIASDTVDEKLSVALKEMTNTFRAVMLEVYEGAARAHVVTFSEIDANISQAFNQLQAATASVTPAVERLLTQQFNTAFSSLAQRLQEIGYLADQAGSRFESFEQMFGELHHVATNLIMDAQRAGADLEVHLRNAHVAQEKQLEIVSAADTLSDALSELVVKAHSGIQDLNGTITEAQASLRAAYHRDFTMSMWPWFRNAATQFLRIDPSVFDLPLFHVLYQCMRALRVVAVFASSILMSAFVLLASARNLFSRYPQQAENHPTTPLSSALSGTTSATATSGTRIMGSVTETRTTGLLGPGYTGGPLLTGPEQGGSKTSTPRNRLRLSRIPDRLCRPL